MFLTILVNFFSPTKNQNIYPKLVVGGKIKGSAANIIYKL